MSPSIRKAIPYCLLLPGVLFAWIGIQANNLPSMSIAALLLLGAAVWELRHPTNSRRTFAARLNLWAMPICLVMFAVAYAVWGGL